MTDFDIVPSVDAPASGICSSTPPRDLPRRQAPDLDGRDCPANGVTTRAWLAGRVVGGRELVVSDEMRPIVEPSADEQLAKDLVEQARTEGVQLVPVAC
jgi:hypothetical protein